jgi:hypothetical protein
MYGECSKEGFWLSIIIFPTKLIFRIFEKMFEPLFNEAWLVLSFFLTVSFYIFIGYLTGKTIDKGIK